MNVRCPHCRQGVDADLDDLMVEIVCSWCGSSFGLVAASDARDSDESMRVIGQFELNEELGRGAFGSVWKAHDLKLDRVVAIKLPHQGRLSTVEQERFLREAQAAARLNHPHIVGVHEVGQEEGQLYIVSDFIEGSTLNDFATNHPLSLRESAELVATMTEALEYAHEQGVVHRDLKPANLLIDDKRRPFITDFGLAKRESDDVTMTAEGYILGTPAYMSPEHARGEAHLADARVDIYSLGVILYELVTGELPFRGNPQMLLMQIIENDAPSPRQFNAAIPRDLETIILTCLHKEPHKRYSSAAELAADLRHWIDGRPIMARPITRLERGWRWCRRNRHVASLTAVSILLLVVGLVAVSVQWLRAEKNLDEAREQQQRAESIFRTARQAIEQSFQQVEVSMRLNDHLAPLRRDLLQQLLDSQRQVYDEFAEGSPPGHELAEDRLARHISLAAYHKTTGDLPQAALHYDQALQICQEIASREPAEMEHQVVLATIQSNRANVLRDSGKFDEATRVYAAAIQSWEDLSDRAEANPKFGRELAETHGNFGLMLSRQRQIPEADAEYRTAVNVLNAHFSSSDDDPETAYLLSGFYGNRAALLAAANRLEEAIVEEQRAIDLMQSAVDRVKTGDGLVRLAALYADMGHLYHDQSEFTIAWQWYDKSLGAFVQHQDLSLPRRGQKALRITHHGLANVLDGLGRHGESVEHWTRVIDLDDGRDRERLLIRRARSYAQADQADRAVEEAEAFRDHKSLTGLQHYLLACVYSLACDAIQRDASLPELQRQERANRFASRAVDELEKARLAGLFDQAGYVEEMKKDADLNSIRERTDFQQLEERIESD